MLVITSRWRGRNSLNIFPDQRCQPVTLTKSDISLLSNQLNIIYVELIDLLAESVRCNFTKSQIHDESLKVVIRGAIVTLTYPFFERLYRVKKLVNKNKGIELGIIEQDFNFNIKTLEDFNKSLSCEKFNDGLISNFSKIWNLKKHKLNQIAELRPLIARGKYKNNLFEVHVSNLKLRIFNLLARAFRIFPPFSRFPVLTLANSETPFLLKGFFFWNFRRINWKKIGDFSTNAELRNVIFNESISEGAKLSNFLFEMGFSDEQNLQIRKIFLDYLNKAYPSQLLEGLLINFNSLLVQLNRFSAPAILMATAISQTESLLATSAARQIKKKVINSQHGGHYGYINGVDAFSELEWIANDVFLSWGWTNSQKINPQLKIIPLPSPWLSERRKYWRVNKFNEVKKFDILLMPQRMSFFTGSPQGLSCIRPDVIDKLSKLIIDFVDVSNAWGLKIYCKPYDYLSMEAMSDTYAYLNFVGEFCECGLPDHKGLNYDLINKANLVVWDQPGQVF